MTLQFVGVAVELAIFLNANQITMPLQQIIGTKLLKSFTEKYCQVQNIDGELCYVFKRDKLPNQADTGIYATPVFQRAMIPVRISDRKK